jgi:hypothetical protein
MQFIYRSADGIKIRELALIVIGRLASRNPCCVLPRLRLYLLHLLTELGNFLELCAGLRARPLTRFARTHF